MFQLIKKSVCIGLFFAISGSMGIQVHAQEENKILPGIYVENISLGGKSAEEAQKELSAYVDELSRKEIPLVAAGGNEIVITPADIGFYWENQGILEEAASIGKKGNVVQRYKAAKDLEHQNVVYQFDFDFDRELSAQVLSERCAEFNVEAKDAWLSREDGVFVVHPGQAGEVIDTEAANKLLEQYFDGNWENDAEPLELPVTKSEPRGTQEELEKVKDVLGTFSTSFKTSGPSRSANVRNGCELINGTVLYPGDEFSTYENVSPFTQANGYYMAGSYLNGQVVDSLGGGICQVSTTLYNAVLLSELEVTERHNHSMIVTYVDPSADAAIAESSGKDFKFVNNYDVPIYIEGYTTEDKQICFTIYGMETRDSGHQVRYESEVVSKTYPDSEVIYANEGLPVGSVSVQSAHIGYKANLWKIVTENGTEVSREKINSSSYMVAPRTATVGVATADPNVYNQIMAAIATNNIDHVKNVAAALAAGTAPPPSEVPAAPDAGAPPADPAAQPPDQPEAQPPAQPETPPA
ncbi:MAG: hypothetical protein HFI45_04290 [Lachnospiraceae bacterium]|nr:hypothetical protein [Lachnospiraceae bacterium]